IQPGMRVLEPSAGSGNIADAIRAACPACRLVLVEHNFSLVEILRATGYKQVTEANGDNAVLLHTDFLEVKARKDGGFDRILMNPPFEKSQDIDHVLHAYSLLRPGGRLVAIMSEHPFFASDAKSAIFRSWLVENYGSDEKLPEGMFRNQATSTGVAARLVLVPKITGT
ncbi:MAG: class I SAM-dependent methyltransferase, partial [Patescibacteria group bacterium]|nr:class I SAM-dependent methyltransferase [Patescibacteria group bacterium]